MNETDILITKSINPDFNYTKTHELVIDKNVLDKIWEGAFIIGLYGKISEEGLDEYKKQKDAPKVEKHANFYDDTSPVMKKNALNEFKPISSEDPNMLAKEIEL